LPYNITCPGGAYSWISSCRRVICLLTDTALHLGHRNRNNPSAPLNPISFWPQFRQYRDCGSIVPSFIYCHLLLSRTCKNLYLENFLCTVENSDAEEIHFCKSLLNSSFGAKPEC